MQTYYIFASTGSVKPNKYFPRMNKAYEVKAENIDNLRRNLIHKKYPKNESWYYQVYSSTERPLGTLFISTYVPKIFDNPISRKYRKGGRVNWTLPDNNSKYDVNPKTGKLVERIL